MKRIIELIKLEIKKPKSMEDFMVITLMFFLIACVTSYIQKDISVLPMNFIKYAPYIIIFSSFYMLGGEFENGTDKIIFSSKYSRMEILVSKLISAVVKIMIIIAFYTIIYIGISLYLKLNLAESFNIKVVIRLFGCGVVYAVTMSSVIFLISLLTNSGKITGVMMYILFFDLMNILLGNAIGSEGLNKSIVYLIENSPFYVANSGLVSGYYSIVQLMFMMVLAAAAFLISTVLLKRRSI